VKHRSGDHHDEIGLDAVTEALLGQRLSLTRLDVARQTGIAAEATAARWRTLGFPDVADDDVAYTKADVAALNAAERVTELISVDRASEEAFLRTVGRTFSRLADWQVRTLLPTLVEFGGGAVTDGQLRQVREILKLGSQVQDNIWRHHLVGAATRLISQYSEEAETELGCAGFVDIVGYTTRSRTVTWTELAALVERFENIASDLITEHGGRVVKTIGDEIFFVVDDPIEAAWLGAELAELHVHDQTFPNVRVGIAHGDLFYRLGDVLGPVVNMASRLTSIARPGRAIVDANLAALVDGTRGLQLRRLRRKHVKGFDSIEPWTVRLDRGGRKGGLRGAIDDVWENAREDIAMRLPQRRS